MKKGKKYLAAVQQYDKNRTYNLEEGIALLPKLSTTKFEGSVEVHVRLNLTETEKKQPVSGAFSLPHSTGKTQKVLVLADKADAEIAQKAGADYSGLEDLTKKIETGWIDYDVVIATPSVMPKIATLGRILGPKGIMPNPKNGTITTEIGKTVKEYKAGKTTFKSDKQGIVHAAIAKTGTEPEAIKKNLITTVKKITEASKKSPGAILLSVTLNPTMGPSIKLNLEDLLAKL